jgi:hypothetical protein
MVVRMHEKDVSGIVLFGRMVYILLWDMVEGDGLYGSRGGKTVLGRYPLCVCQYAEAPPCLISSIDSLLLYLLLKNRIRFYSIFL